MSMLDWAENEINLFKKDADKYMQLCADSALKAYKSLMEDEHSGMSFGITVSILKRLCDEKPIAPITEKDFDGVKAYNIEINGIKHYQCPRMSSLFKEEYEDKISYDDINRVLVTDKNGNTWHNGLIRRLVNEKYPITFPYSGEKYSVYCDEYTITETGEKIYDRGSYNRIFIKYIIRPDGTREDWNKEYEA